MTEQIHRALHPDTEDRSLHLEGTSHAPEDVQEEEDIGDIGTVHYRAYTCMYTAEFRITLTMNRPIRNLWSA